MNPPVRPHEAAAYGLASEIRADGLATQIADARRAIHVRVARHQLPSGVSWPVTIRIDHRGSIQVTRCGAEPADEAAMEVDRWLARARRLYARAANGSGRP